MEKPLNRDSISLRCTIRRSRKRDGRNRLKQARKQFNPWSLYFHGKQISQHKTWTKAFNQMCTMQRSAIAFMHGKAQSTVFPIKCIKERTINELSSPSLNVTYRFSAKRKMDAVYEFCCLFIRKECLIGIGTSLLRVESLFCHARTIPAG